MKQARVNSILLRNKYLQMDACKKQLEEFLNQVMWSVIELNKKTKQISELTLIHKEKPIDEKISVLTKDSYEVMKQMQDLYHIICVGNDVMNAILSLCCIPENSSLRN